MLFWDALMEYLNSRSSLWSRLKFKDNVAIGNHGSGATDVHSFVTKLFGIKASLLSTIISKRLIQLLSLQNEEIHSDLQIYFFFCE